MNDVRRGGTQAGFEREVAEHFIVAFRQRRQCDGKCAVVLAHGMDVRERRPIGLADEKKMQQLAVVARELEVIILPEIFFAERQVQDALGICRVHFRRQIRPAAVAQARTKIIFLQVPPFFPAEQREREHKAGDAGGNPVFSPMRGRRLRADWQRAFARRRANDGHRAEK